MTLPDNLPPPRRFLFLDPDLVGPPQDAEDKPDGYTRMGADGTIYRVTDGSYEQVSGGGGLTLGDYPSTEQYVYCDDALEPLALPALGLYLQELMPTTVFYASGDGDVLTTIIQSDNFESYYPYLAASFGVRLTLDVSGCTAGDVLTMWPSRHGAAYYAKQRRVLSTADITGGEIDWDSTVVLDPSVGVSPKLKGPATALLTYAEYQVNGVTPVAAPVVRKRLLIGENGGTTGTVGDYPRLFMDGANAKLDLGPFHPDFNQSAIFNLTPLRDTGSPDSLTVNATALSTVLDFGVPGAPGVYVCRATPVITADFTEDPTFARANLGLLYVPLPPSFTDNFADKGVISGQGQQTFDNTGFTREPGEPGQRPTSSAWATFVPTASGAISIDTELTTGTSTILSLYSGPPGATFAQLDNGLMDIQDTKLVTAVTAGTTYYVSAGMYDVPGVADFTVRWDIP